MLNILNPCINYVTKCKPISVPLMLVKFLLKDVIIYAEPKFFPLPTFPSLTSSISLNSLEPLLEKAEEAHARARAHTHARTHKPSAGEITGICELKACSDIIPGLRPEKRKTLKD